MGTADLYLRLSLDFEGATAIERQEAECRRWCREHHLQVREVHIDRGVSGFHASARRNGFESAVAAVVAGQVSTLVVWKLDRLSRRGVGQVGQVLDTFESCGGRLISVVDQLDTAQPQARMIIALLSEFARAESEIMGVRIRSAKEAQRARGLWLSGKPPIGYAVAADQRLTPVEPAASAVRQVFTMLARGHTLVQACAYLNAQGIRNSRGRPWRDSALSGALRTSAYAGLQPERHVTATGEHASGKPAIYRDRETGLEVSCLTPGAQPIVSRALQLAAFEAMEQRRRRYAEHSRPIRPAHALLTRSLGHCASCARPVVLFGGSYKCRRIDRDGSLACQAPVSASRLTVDAIVTSAWLELVTSHSPDTDLLRQAVTLTWGLAPRHPPRWIRLHADLVDLHTRLADADLAHYVRGDLDRNRHERVTAELTKRIASVEAVLADTNLHISTRELDDRTAVADRFEAEQWETKRRLLRLAWSAITVAKAQTRGGVFDPSRVRFVREVAPLGCVTWIPLG